ncbi:hypothetical protein PF003_g18772 [Phytophthora fragariae]|nr:hypothetical protein PF003_g18772 [Phytophthora fragariae]
MSGVNVTNTAGWPNRSVRSAATLGALRVAPPYGAAAKFDGVEHVGRAGSGITTASARRRYAALPPKLFSFQRVEQRLFCHVAVSREAARVPLALERHARKQLLHREVVE